MKTNAPFVEGYKNMKTRILLLIAAFVMIAVAAHAESTPSPGIKQSGSVTADHPACWNGTKIVKDSGNTCAAQTFTGNATFIVTGNAAVGFDITSNWYIFTRAGTLKSATAVAKTAPVGAALVFDILKSTNGGTSFTSIWSSDSSKRIQLASGTTSGSQTSFTTAGFNAGDLLRLDVIAIGTSVPGANVTIKLAYTEGSN